ncbi:sigma-O factor regulator RsoA [Bacillus sp. 0909A]|uniref:sigma-O factor regulator RsoA n=1 Tax=Bacillus sp. 0909A TaxID=3120561 RepID=UPI002FD936B6
MSGEFEHNRDHDEMYDIEYLIACFSPMIRKKLSNTSYQEREDLEQELKIKMFEKADMLLCQDVPGFWEFILYMVDENS